MPRAPKYCFTSTSFALVLTSNRHTDTRTDRQDSAHKKLCVLKRTVVVRTAAATGRLLLFGFIAQGKQRSKERERLRDGQKERKKNSRRRKERERETRRRLRDLAEGTANSIMIVLRRGKKDKEDAQDSQAGRQLARDVVVRISYSSMAQLAMPI